MSPRWSVSGATSIRIGCLGKASATLRLAIYDDDDAGAKIAGGSVTWPTSTGIGSVTGLTPFNLSQFKRYRFCICLAASSGSSYLGVSASSSLGETKELFSAFTANAGAATGADCTSTVPSATGALTTTANRLVPVFIVE